MSGWHPLTLRYDLPDSCIRVVILLDMDQESKKRIQVVLLVAMVLAGLRVVYIFFERRNDAEQAAQQEKQLQLKKDTLPDADYYVSLRKIHAYDLASAQELTKGPAWVRTGYSSAYFPFDTSSKHVRFGLQTGLLTPLQKLQITDVVFDHAPTAPVQKQIMAVFEQEGKHYAFSIGAAAGSSFTWYADDMLFYDDPHELYKHWSADVWDAIGKHEVRPGMNELQADCAVGLGLLDGSGLGEERTLRYANGGKPLTVMFRGGKAVEIKAGS